MKIHSFSIYFAAFILLLIAGCKSDPKQEQPITHTPESLGISSRAIIDFIEAAETERKDDLHSFVLLKNGQTAAEGWWAPYDSTSRHMMYSLSKSFTSTAIGLAQEEGLLSIYDPVIKFFPEHIPENSSANLENMRIKDLLRMSTGHDQDSWGRIQQDEQSWVRAYLHLPVEHKPGTHFRYNTGATFMLSAIIQKVTKQNLLQYLQPRFFEPLEIKNPTWDKNPDGMDLGGTGLNIRTRDIAKFGQLLLQEGSWNGKQLVPSKWIHEATTLQTSNGSNPESDWDQGYGYQFWRCKPENVYRGDGAFGQYCIVMPDQQAVLAITSGTDNMQAILNLVWDHLLPAMRNEPLPEDTTAFTTLREKLSNLALSKVSGAESSPTAANISGKTYDLSSNDIGLEKLEFQLDDNKQQIIFHQNGETYSIPFQTKSFARGIMQSADLGEQVIASSGAWTSDDTLWIRTYLYETPYYLDYTFTFDQDEIIFEQEINVSFDPDKRTVIKGLISSIHNYGD